MPLLWKFLAKNDEAMKNMSICTTICTTFV